MKTLFIFIPKLVSALSGSTIYKQVHILILFYYFIFTRKILGLKKEFLFPFTYNGVDIPMYLISPKDLVLLREIFIKKEYDYFLSDPAYIIDLGANFGDTALYYHALFPKAKIFAVEPAPNNFNRLTRNTVNIENIVRFQVAIGPDDGVLELNLQTNSLGHSSINREDTRDSIVVEQISLDTLFSRCGIKKADIIKFDIEGAEFDLFKSLNPAKYASVYIGEVHADLVNFTLSDFVSYFEGYSADTKIFHKKNRMIFYAKEIIPSL